MPYFFLVGNYGEIEGFQLELLMSMWFVIYLYVTDFKHALVAVRLMVTVDNCPQP